MRKPYPPKWSRYKVTEMDECENDDKHVAEKAFPQEGASYLLDNQDKDELIEFFKEKIESAYREKDDAFFS